MHNSLPLSRTQWTYTCGNNWGTCEDGSSDVGCGPQEMFRACSDIRITGSPEFHPDLDIVTNEVFDEQTTERKRYVSRRCMKYPPCTITHE